MDTRSKHRTPGGRSVTEDHDHLIYTLLSLSYIISFACKLNMFV